jgi:hypothetical protein
LKIQNILNSTGLFILIIVLSSVVLTHVSFVNSAEGLTRYFNCVTRAANNNDTVSLENVKNCYYKVFQGARDNAPDGSKLK